MALVGTFSQIKLHFGPLVIQLVWYILKQCYSPRCRLKLWIITSPLFGSVNIHHYSPPLRWIIVNYMQCRCLMFGVCTITLTHFLAKTQHSCVPLLSPRRDSPPQSSPTFSVWPPSSVGRVTVDLIRRLWIRFPLRWKEFFLPCVVPWFPLLGLMPSGSLMGYKQHFNLHFRVNSLFHHLCW